MKMEAFTARPTFMRKEERSAKFIGTSPEDLLSGDECRPSASPYERKTTFEEVSLC